MGITYDDAFWSSVQRLVRMKTNGLIGRYGFREDDRENIQQELLLRVATRLPQFDPQRALLRTYIARIIDSRIATMIKANRAAKRCAPGRVASFDDDEPEYCDKPWRSLADTYSNEDWRRKIHGFVRAAEEEAELTIDVRHALELLPPKSRQLAYLLMRMNVTQVAEHLGMPRTTIDYRRRQLGRELKDLDLEKYL